MYYVPGGGARGFLDSAGDAVMLQEIACKNRSIRTPRHPEGPIRTVFKKRETFAMAHVKGTG